MALPALEGKPSGAEMVIRLGKVTSLTDTTTLGSGHISEQASYFPNTESESQGPSFNKTQKFPMPLGTQLEHVPEPGPGTVDSIRCSSNQKRILVVVSWKSLCRPSMQWPTHWLFSEFTVVLRRCKGKQTRQTLDSRVTSKSSFWIVLRRVVLSPLMIMVTHRDELANLPVEIRCLKLAEG